jgi:hypothetical protein
VSLSVGELSATLTLRDMLSAQLANVNKAIANTGAQFQAVGAQAAASMAGLSSGTLGFAAKIGGMSAAAQAAGVVLYDAYNRPIQPLGELAKNTVSGMSLMASSALKMAGALGIGFSVASVVRFGKSVLDDADLLTKLHDKTGIAVEGLQRMRVAGDDASVSLDSMTMAVSMMQRRLAGNEDSALSALRDLKINLDALRQMAPDQQFMAIADAIRQVKDPAEQAKLAVDLFGRGGAEVLPVIKRGFDDVKDAAVGMSAGSIAAIDLLGDRLKAAGRSVAAYAGEWAGVMLQGGPLMAQAIEAARILDAIRTSAELAAPKIAGIAPPGLPKDLDEIYTKLEQERVALNQVADAAAKVTQELQQDQKVHEDYIASIGNRLFGADDIKRALDYADAIGRVENISNMNAEAQADVAEIMRKGIEAMVASGISTDALSSRFEEMRLAATATGRDAAAAFGAIVVSAAQAAQAIKSVWNQAGIGGNFIAADPYGGSQGTVLPGGTITTFGGPDSMSDFSTYSAHPIPGMADGGSVSSGRPVVVGERGPELFVPGASGSIVPGVGGTTLNIYVTQPLGTPDAIGKAIMANLRSQWIRFPLG